MGTQQSRDVVFVLSGQSPAPDVLLGLSMALVAYLFGQNV
jgi:hypothetical protein